MIILPLVSLIIWVTLAFLVLRRVDKFLIEANAHPILTISLHAMAFILIVTSSVIGLEFVYALIS